MRGIHEVFEFVFKTDTFGITLNDPIVFMEFKKPGSI